MKTMLFAAVALVLLFSGPMRAAENPQPESAEETIQRLEAEIRVLRSTIAALVKENKDLKAENAALRGQGSEGAAAATPKPAEKDKTAAPQKVVEFGNQEDFIVGAVGRLPYIVRVEQVLGTTEVVISMNVQVGEREESVGSVSPWDRGITRIPTRTVPIIKRWRFLLSPHISRTYWVLVI